jgi:DNA transposition AAA+ family ATPase
LSSSGDHETVVPAKRTKSFDFLRRLKTTLAFGYAIVGQDEWMLFRGLRKKTQAPSSIIQRDDKSVKSSLQHQASRQKRK